MTFNRKQKTTLIATLVVLAASAAVWAYSGFSLFTRQQIPVQIYDELLGTSYTEWKDAMIVGLDIVGPVALAVLATGLLLIRLFRTKLSH